jgi:alpha-N-acetylglucosamine transferase
MCTFAGADEFIKLYAYSLTQYHRVVHLDMDSVIYKNMVKKQYCMYI